jgi:hypothetical protein
VWNDVTGPPPAHFHPSGAALPEAMNSYEGKPSVMADRLLLIEDDKTIGEVLTSSLRGQGHDVVWERVGQGGLARPAAGF